MKPVSVALVGCGAIAELGHLPAARFVPEIDFTVLIDRDASRARALADRFGIPNVATEIAAAADYAEAACVALPPHVHRIAAEALFERGLHVLMEKPLATNLADSEAIVAAASSAQCVLAVAMVRRFAPSSLQMRRIVESGMLGPIRRFSVVSGVGDAWPAHSLYMLRAFESGGGVLLSNGCHDLDMLTWLLGPIERFNCKTDSRSRLDGNFWIECTMQSGAQGVVELSRTRSLDNGIELDGEYATVWAPLMGDTVSIVPRGAQRIEGKISGAPFDFSRAMAAQFRDFARAIRAHTAPLVDGDEGHEMVALIERLYAAAEPASLPWMQSVHLPGML